MNKKDLQKLYDRLLLQNETYKQYIIHTAGPQAIDRLDMEIAIQETNKVLEDYNKKQIEYR